MYDEEREALAEELERLRRMRRSMTEEIGHLAHQDRRLADAEERRSRPIDTLARGRRDLARGRKLAERDIAKIDARIAALEKALAQTP